MCLSDRHDLFNKICNVWHDLHLSGYPKVVIVLLINSQDSSKSNRSKAICELYFRKVQMYRESL
jgi:uncharacterized protein (UPF0335 family)